MAVDRASDSLVELIRALSRPLEPIATREQPRRQRLPDIRAVVFDLYGTLFVSGSGDIGAAQAMNRSEAILAALRAENLPVPKSVTDLGARLHALVEASHVESRAEGIDYPEVEIRTIWGSLMGELGIETSPEAIARVAVRYECAVNPVWPMPGMEDLLAAVRERVGWMGIISNAQFFTPLLFEALTGKPWVDFGFREHRALWSYVERRAKPSGLLFTKLAGELAIGAIEPSQAVYIGNDMRNDIAPAAACGFRTALFAGDCRSLRWRSGEGLGLEPDLVLTGLSQLLDCL